MAAIHPKSDLCLIPVKDPHQLVMYMLFNVTIVSNKIKVQDHFKNERFSKSKETYKINMTLPLAN